MHCLLSMFLHLRGIGAPLLLWIGEEMSNEKWQFMDL